MLNEAASPSFFIAEQWDFVSKFQVTSSQSASTGMYFFNPDWGGSRRRTGRPRLIPGLPENVASDDIHRHNFTFSKKADKYSDLRGIRNNGGDTRCGSVNVPKFVEGLRPNGADMVRTDDPLPARIPAAGLVVGQTARARAKEGRAPSHNALDRWIRWIERDIQKGRRPDCRTALPLESWLDRRIRCL